jgi:hypothetical protein
MPYDDIRTQDTCAYTHTKITYMLLELIDIIKKRSLQKSHILADVSSEEDSAKACLVVNCGGA